MNIHYGEHQPKDGAERAADEVAKCGAPYQAWLGPNLLAGIQR